MRGTLRLLAKVQPAKFLEVNAPTGLTGILTHPQPRPTLIYTYKQILNKLEAIPKSSVYRQSTEAIAKSRLKIVEETKPAGYEEWVSRVKSEIEKNPAAYSHVLQKDGSIAFSEPFSTTSEVWDGRAPEALPEGPSDEATANLKGQAVKAEEERQAVEEPPRPSQLEQEPPLDADQYGASSPKLLDHAKYRRRINDIENKIGAGLIEEVIMVADGELTLVDEMIASRVYAGSFSSFGGPVTNNILDGSLLKNELLQDSGNTSSEGLTQGLLRSQEVKGPVDSVYTNF
jgi:NADH dehydrogenase (ubiquinone) 1 alpha subcomplex subunit 5